MTQFLLNSHLESLMEWIYGNMILFLSGLVILGTLITIFRLCFQLIDLQKQRLNIEDPSYAAQADGPSFFQKLYAKAWSLVPMDKEQEIELDHAYDGIKELDNRLPPWWLYLFYITIIWAIVYVWLFHFSSQKMTQVEEYQITMEEAEEIKKAYLKKQANAVDEYNVAFLLDNSAILEGEKTFKSYCAACHGQEGQGGVGPNLTDDYWIHGGSASDIFKTIKYGIPEKGMIAWKSQISPSSMQNITSFIAAINGTEPANAKEPQGELYISETTSEDNQEEAIN